MDGRELRDQVCRLVRAQLAGAQVDRAVEDVEREWVRVELLGSDDDRFLACGEADHRPQPGLGLRCSRPGEDPFAFVIVVAVGGVVVDRSRGLLGRADQRSGVVACPARAVPGVPSEAGHVANVSAVPRGQAFGVAEVGERERDPLEPGDLFGCEAHAAALSSARANSRRSSRNAGPRVLMPHSSAPSV